jgi:hypothetical protein
MHKIKLTSKARLLTHSLMALFGTDRRNETLVAYSGEIGHVSGAKQATRPAKSATL